MITTPRISLALMLILMTSATAYSKNSAQVMGPNGQGSQATEDQGKFLILVTSEDMLETSNITTLAELYDKNIADAVLLSEDDMLEALNVALNAEDNNARAHLDLEESLLAPTNPKQDLASFVQLFQENSDKLLLQANLLDGASLSFALMATTTLSVVYIGTPYGLRVAMPVAVVAGLAAAALHIIFFSN